MMDFDIETRIITLVVILLGMGLYVYVSLKADGWIEKYFKSRRE